MQVKVRNKFDDLAKMERVGRAHDKVTELVAVAQPDEGTVCVEGDQVDLAALQKQLQAELSHVAFLFRIQKMAQLPRLPSGKVDRASLQEQCAAV